MRNKDEGEVKEGENREEVDDGERVGKEHEEVRYVLIGQDQEWRAIARNKLGNYL